MGTLFVKIVLENNSYVAKYYSKGSKISVQYIVLELAF